MDHYVKLLARVDKSNEVLQQCCSIIEELNILEPFTIEVATGDGTEKKFDEIADSFRDPRVWWIKDGEWWKNNIWGKPSSYGKVYLKKDKWTKYYIE